VAFPTIPTVAAGRILGNVQADTTSLRTGPSLTNLTGKQAGDLLIAICFVYDGNSTNAEFSSWSSGFTEFGDFATTATLSIGCAYKWSTGSETGAVTVTSTATQAGHAAMILMAIPGAHATTIPEAGGYTTVVGCDPGSLDPTGWATEDTLWIAAAGCGESATIGSFTGISGAPTNYTDFLATGISADVVGGIEGAVAFRSGLAAASEDPGAFSNDTSSTRGAAITIAIRPAVSTEASAALASASGDAFNATISAVAGDANVPAGTATATGAAFNPTIDIGLLTVNRAIVAGSDDGFEDAAGSPGLADATILLDTVGDAMGLRFTDLPIQQSANILQATVDLTVAATDKNDAEGTWYAHDVDDAPTFTTTNGDIDGRTRTTASVAWTTNDLGSSGARVSTPNLAAVLKEVVDRPGWQPGNNVAFIYVHNSATDKLELAELEHPTLQEATLHVEYQSIPVVEGLVTGTFGFTGSVTGDVVSGGVNAGTATATGAANNPTVQAVGATDAIAALASATGDAFNPTVQAVGATDANAALASATGDAFNPAIQTSGGTNVNAGLAAATGDASNPTVTVASNFAVNPAAATGDAFNATVQISGAADATAADAAATGAAFNPTITTAGVVAAGTATATGVANNATVQAAGVSDALADDALVTGTAFNPTVTAAGNPTAGLAAATGAAFNPTIQTEIIVPPTIPVAVQDPSHAVAVTDPAKIMLVTDLPTALVVTTNGQHSAVVSDTAKTVTVRDNDHNLMVSTPD
jgi:hypothetical protein